MDAATAMDGIKNASAIGDLYEVERLYREACADIGNIIEDKAALCLYCVYAFLNAKDYANGERFLLEALEYSNDPRCRSIRGQVLYNLFRLKYNQGDMVSAVNYGQMAMVELEYGMPDTHAQIEYIRNRIG